MKVLVCGGRDYDNAERVKRVLDKLLIRCGGNSGLTIIQGEALGADTLARQWAEDNSVPTIGFRADWKTYGKRAGYLRNSQMLTEGHPDLVIAFPGGNGTDMMIKLAKAAGVSVVKLEED